MSRRRFLVAVAALVASPRVLEQLEAAPAAVGPDVATAEMFKEVYADAIASMMPLQTPLLAQLQRRPRSLYELPPSGGGVRYLWTVRLE